MRNLMLESVPEGSQSVRSSVARKLCLSTGLASVVLGLMIGICITYVIMRDNQKLSHQTTSPEPSLSPDEQKIRNKLLENIESKRIANWLKLDIIIK
jgi:hypothetical protein